jgi:hypothetical protein
MSRRFVDGSVIRRRMQAKDDRMNAQLEAFRRRTSNAALFPKAPVIDVVLAPVTAGPVVEVTVTPATHFCEYDRIQPGAVSVALCGAWVEESDIQASPTCAACAADLARTADDVFGTDEPFAALRPRPAKATLPVAHLQKETA